ncbi:bile acid:sodium symporter family protein [Verrucomicrobium sp. 3C]|uniref:bile acid:sodium symporter family protein n=1 Tax=Verrucomicrobium sp. 3C TaxID=1134055 RepID=UPI0005950863|nr:bile acid:sodium symporter [Verrucomicrobium sp. 3C]
MEEETGRIALERLGRLLDWLHRHFFWALIAAHGLAALAPDFGQRIRRLTFGSVPIFGESFSISLPVLLLFLLLWNSGFGVPGGRLRELFRNFRALLPGLLVNFLIPLFFLAVLRAALLPWHNQEEVENLVMGLGIVVAMPIAGASAAWCQNAGGDMALSLGLVLSSTVLSPFAGSLALHAVAPMVAGDYAEDLREMAGRGMGIFLLLCVVLPSLLGILVRHRAGETFFARVRPALRPANELILLWLIYMNAAVALPYAFRNFDADFLAMLLVTSGILCLLRFQCGAWLGRLLRASVPERTALLYGLGMNNNGSGLVLAAAAVPDHPLAILPIVFYTLLQQITAAWYYSYWIPRRNV